MPPGGLARSVAASDLLDRLRPLLPSVGITRVAVLTGLDGLGIPVAAAIRPNSRTIAVHQGKGATTAAAKLGAVMEGLECHCAEQLDLPVRVGTPAEMAARRTIVDVDRLPRRRHGADPHAARLLWVEGDDLLEGGKILVPREVVAADWSLPPPPGEVCFQATTNGLGAGATHAEATLHALGEVIERDAVALWRTRPAGWRDERAVDPASVDGPASRALLDRLAAMGAWVAIWDATSDVGVPVFVVLVGDSTGRLQPELGFGCHPDPDAALWRAITEAAQSRLTVISGARDDFGESDYDPRARLAAAAAARASPARRAFSATAPADFSSGLQGMLAALRLAGIAQVACINLTPPDLFRGALGVLPGIAVVRIVVPGLEGVHTGPEGEYVPGRRARAVAA